MVSREMSPEGNSTLGGQPFASDPSLAILILCIIPFLIPHNFRKGVVEGRRHQIVSELTASQKWHEIKWISALDKAQHIMNNQSQQSLLSNHTKGE